MGGRSTLYCQGEELVLLVNTASLIFEVVLRIGKLQGIGEFSGVGFISTQQMVINSPCLTDTKNWLFQCKRHLLWSWLVLKQTTLVKDFSIPLMVDSCQNYLVSIHRFYYEELAIPEETATGKESSNPFKASSLPKTIHFCDSLQSDEDSFELIELMILCTNFLTMLNTAYPFPSDTAYPASQRINMAYPFPLDTAYRSSRTEAEIFDFRAKILPFFETNPTDCSSLVSDQLMLRVFPISLTGATSRWLRNEQTGSIKTWEDLKTKFLNKYCPPGCTAKKIEEINNFQQEPKEINNFQQEPDETLYQAWERFKELLIKCPQHYLTEMQEMLRKPSKKMAEYSQKWHNGTSRGRSTETSDGLAAVQAQLNNLGREIKKVNENFYAA
ncbi:retrovirus-related pol polyprotein from transposon TNT 1-94 [Tanacetum coccineum]